MTLRRPQLAEPAVPPRNYMTATDAAPTVTMAAASAPLVDVAARTIEGLAVPFGPVGQTSAGRLQFSPGSLSWASPRRVKLLREHAQGDSVGFAVELVELDAAEVDARLAAAGQDPVGQPGLWARYSVPEGENGDRALAEAANGVRDAFSVGVHLDDKTAERLRRSQGAAVQGSGALRETSLVAIPAFDDARVGSVAANADLVVAAWSDPTPTPHGDAMRCTSCHHFHAAGVTACQPEHVEAAQAALAAASASTNTPPPAPAPEAEPPAVVTAVAGAATVTGEPSTYTFGADPANTGSLVGDAVAWRFDGNAEAAERFHRFNAELTDGNPASVMALAAVMQTTDPDSVPLLQPNVRRPDLLIESIDRGRPLNGRVRTVPIRNATPFLIPKLGEFVGIGDHVEGTAHRAEGSITTDERTLAPKSVSGAFRLSREMADSSNPALDRVALRAMLKAYRKDTEGRLVLLLTSGDAQGGITTVDGVRAELIAFGTDDIEADVIVAGKGMFQALALDKDTTGRPMLPFLSPSNASGTLRAGYTGASIDGVEIAKSSAMPVASGVIWDTDSTLVVESATQTFRFEEVEGPGIIKLALWGYYGAALLDVAGAKEISTAPEPVV